MFFLGLRRFHQLSPKRKTKTKGGNKQKEPTVVEEDDGGQISSAEDMMANPVGKGTRRHEHVERDC